MRLKKGTKVEVLTQKEVPSGSWRCAEIIGGNGHSYTVRYDGEIGSFGMVERVSWKLIRPCPPSVDVLEDWMPGDVVEVFHNFSWKIATVLKVSGRNQLLVRLLGSSIEYKANKVDVRARLCWQDGEWVVIGKAFGKHEDMRFRLPSSRKNDDQAQKRGTTATRRIKVDHVPARNINGVLDSQHKPSMTLKKKASRCHPEFEAYAGRKQKIRVGEKNSIWHQFNVMQQPQLPEKVDDVACSREMLAKKCMHSSFVNKITGCSELILVSEKTDGVGCLRSTSLESNDDESVSSSVGSCSVYGNFSHKLHHGLTAGPSEDNDNQCSDAESFCQSRSEEGTCLPAKEELTEEIHRLELHAYRCFIGALHASGPLSWEQELLLTNLRESLHISNDEHLMEIRNLVSSNACIPSS